MTFYCERHVDNQVVKSLFQNGHVIIRCVTMATALSLTELGFVSVYKDGKEFYATSVSIGKYFFPISGNANIA